MQDLLKLVKKPNFPLYFTATIAISVLLLFYPALFNFYSHDDFFHFRIAQAETVSEFINFFNPDGPMKATGFYRPLSAQVTYWFIANIFQYHAFATHLFIFFLYGILLYLVFKLVNHVTSNAPLAYLSTFFYAVSASHFSHLYTIAGQDLIVAIFYVLACWSYVRFIPDEKPRWLLISHLSFIAALLSKESAVTIPLILSLLGPYVYFIRSKHIPWKRLFTILSGHGFILAGYLYFRVFEYGLVQGNSYHASFSPGSILNSLWWYILWAFNVPQMLVDFVGPGLRINPNLWLFWSKQIIPIGVILVTLAIIMLWQLNLVRKEFMKTKELLLLGVLAIWFIISLAPVLVFQWHKFPSYLAIPMIPFSLFLASIIKHTFVYFQQHKQLNLGIAFGLLSLGLFSLSSYLTLKLTKETNWITTGAETAQQVEQFIEAKYSQPNQPLAFYFYDTQRDADLPWSPTNEIKLVLSDNNYFQVFYPHITAYYTEKPPQGLRVVELESRQFLPY